MTASGPHAVLIVGHDLDARTRQTAVWLARAGLRVSVVAVAADGVRSQSQLGEALVVRAPLPFAARAARQARPAGSSQALPIGPGPAAEQLLRRRLTVWGRDAVLRPPTASRVQAELAWRALGALRIAAGVRRRSDALQRRLWPLRGDHAIRGRPGDSGQDPAPAGGADLELVLGPEIDRLEPRVVHSFGLPTIAARAVARARAHGRAAAWVCDAPVAERPPRRVPPAAVLPDREGAEREADLWDAYGGMLGGALSRPAPGPALAAPAERRVLRAAEDPDAVRHVGIGPANMAGQAWEWAKALERSRPDVATEVIAVASDLGYPADVLVPAAVYARDADWAERLAVRVTASWTHALLESGRPLLGLRNGRDFTGDVDVLRAAGLWVGLVLHGSEIRDPARHARLHPWSPFRPRHRPTRRLQAVVDRLAPLVEAFDGPKLVSTPDLLTYVPDATWLPVVVDPSLWTSPVTPMRRDRPVVLHAPSRAFLKGSDVADAAMAELAAEGLVEYRRIGSVPSSEMPALIADADIVLDQFVLGLYGVMACQSLAAGRVTVGYLGDVVRGAAAGAAGQDVPIVEATPADLVDVVRRLVAERDQAAAAAAAGPAFVAELHDGRRSAAILASALGLRTR